MGRTNRISRHDQAPSPRKWLTMDTAPKDGSRVELLIPYTNWRTRKEECADQGYWDATAKWPFPPFTRENPDVGCWRFDGDDGAFDLEPVGWRPLLTVNP